MSLDLTDTPRTTDGADSFASWQCPRWGIIATGRCVSAQADGCRCSQAQAAQEAMEKIIALGIARPTVKSQARRTHCSECKRDMREIRGSVSGYRVSCGRDCAKARRLRIDRERRRLGAP
jgi:hypothetical protein